MLNRESRVHVVTVRSDKERYFVILSDGSEIEWSVYVKNGRDWV